MKHIETLINGKNIGQLLEADQLDLTQKLDIAKQAVARLQTFHHTHLHRDIKPENFIWDPDLQKLHLCDFGLTCDISNSEGFVELSGSGTFLAPKIDKAAGQAVYTKKTDIYALGQTLKALFDQESISQSLSDMIKGMTAADPEQRFSDMDKMSDIILDAQNTTHVSSFSSHNLVGFKN